MSVRAACSTERNGPISPPDIEMTPKMPDTASSKKLSLSENMMPVKSLSSAPKASVLLRPTLSAQLVSSIVMKRSPIIMRVNSRPTSC